MYVNNMNHFVVPVNGDARKADVVIAYTAQAGQNLREWSYDQIFPMSV